jgi:hypothetical protein
MNCHMWIISVAITLVLLSVFSYSSVSALSLQSVIHHQNKAFSKKQDGGSNSNGGSSGGSSGNSNTKGSDNLNNEDNSNSNIDKKNNQGTNHGTNTGHHNNLAIEPPKTGGQQQQQITGENIPPIMTTPAPMPSIICEQGSNCTDQQGVNDQDRSSSSMTSSATTSEQDNNSNNNTPFVLSLPFP